MLLRRAAMALLVIAGALVPPVDWLTVAPARADPQRIALEQQICALAASTKPGDTVTLAVPESLRDSGYLKYRAQYLLPGRRVILK